MDIISRPSGETDPPPTNPRTVEVYGRFSWSKDCTATSNRADAVLLARLRAGHTPLLKAYDNLLDLSADPLCPLCKEEPQTIEHWLRRCPRLDSSLQNIFGSPSPPPKDLSTDPEKVLALARVTLGQILGAEASTTATTTALTGQNQCLRTVRSRTVNQYGNSSFKIQ